MRERWIDILEKEHELIRQALDRLEREAHELPGLQQTERLETLFHILLEYGDKIHNVKEENHLFPRMVERGIPHSGPIHERILEHEAERELLASFQHRLSLLPDLAVDERIAFEKKLLEYVATRRRHIAQEESELYPLAARSLNESDKGKLIEAFAIVEQKSFGEAPHLHFSQLLAGLRESVHRDPFRHLSEQALRAIIASLPFEMIFVDADGVVRYQKRRPEGGRSVLPELPIGAKVERVPLLPDGADPMILGSADGLAGTIERKVTVDGIGVRLQFVPVRDREQRYLGFLQIVTEA